MIQTVLTILIILLCHHTVECQPCPGCDPDIPSRQTPTDQWYQQEPLSKICQAGQYLDSQKQCKQCLVGTFMTATMARTGKYEFCPACLKVLAVDLEKVIKECNSTRDTEIHCKEGHYRANRCDCEWECHRCSICGVGLQLHLMYERRPCGANKDTVCCHNEDDDVVGDGCVPRPTTTMVATTSTTTEATRPEPSEEIVERKSSKNHNSAKAIEILYSLVSLCFFTSYIL